MAGQFYCVSSDVARWIRDEEKSNISGKYEDVVFGDWMFRAPFAVSHVSYFDNESIWRHNVKGEKKIRDGVLFRQRQKALEALHVMPSLSLEDYEKQQPKKVSLMFEQKKSKVMLLTLKCSRKFPLKRLSPLFTPFDYDSTVNKLSWCCRHNYSFVVEGCNMLLPKRP
jgi:hypothetical protein